MIEFSSTTFHHTADRFYGKRQWFNFRGLNSLSTLNSQLNL